VSRARIQAPERTRWRGLHPDDDCPCEGTGVIEHSPESVEVCSKHTPHFVTNRPEVTVTVCPPMPAHGLSLMNDYMHTRTRGGGQVNTRGSSDVAPPLDARAIALTRQKSRAARVRVAR
jgi:hypothetical protein